MKKLFQIPQHPLKAIHSLMFWLFTSGLIGRLYSHLPIEGNEWLILPFPLFALISILSFQRYQDVRLDIGIRWFITLTGIFWGLQ